LIARDREVPRQEYRDIKADYERQTTEFADILVWLNVEQA
jgi:hypothetical protein